MNQRIVDDLVLKARTSAITDTKDGGKQFNLEVFHRKFAELLVHQMLDITDAHTEVFQIDRDRALIEHIKQSVKQHFGVEEK